MYDFPSFDKSRTLSWSRDEAFLLFGRYKRAVGLEQSAVPSTKTLSHRPPFY